MTATASPLAALRAHLGLSLAEVGEALKISRSAVCHIEKGRSRLRGEHVLEIKRRWADEMEAAGIEADDLIRGEFRRSGRVRKSA